MRRTRVFESLVGVMHRTYGVGRHRRIHALAARPATGTIESLRGHRTCAVVTFKKDGTAVATPVWFGLHDGCVYFRVERSSGKAKRLRFQDEILIAPCTSRGKPLGPASPATARLLDGDEAARAEAVIQSAFGAGRALYERTLTHPDGIYVEAIPRGIGT